MRALPRLVALSPGTLRSPEVAGFLERVRDALAAGLPGLLLREPGLDDRALLQLADGLASELRAHDAWFALHDRAHLALAVGADALHASFRSLPPRELRPWLDAQARGGPRLALGLSTHVGDPAGAWDGADYVFHGPLRPVHKHGLPAAARTTRCAGPAELALALQRAPGPLLVLGGVRPEDVPALLAAGAHGVAVLSSLLGAADPAAATARYLAALAVAPSA